MGHHPSLRHAAAALLLGAAFLYTENVLHWSHKGGLAKGVSVLDIQLCWTRETGLSTLQALGPAGVQAYMQTEQTTDLIFPIVYASLLSVLMDASTPTNPGLFRRAAILLPALAATADFVENTAILSLCREYVGLDVRAPDALVFVGGSVATPLKWGTAAASILVIAVSTLVVACERAGSRTSRSHAD
jgi:hypothetical protein